MAEFKRNPDEPIEKVLRKFKRKVKEEGILLELKSREFFEKPSIVKKRNKKSAVRRNKTQQAKDNW
ncbi:MAG: 30S ribosomal protein S21 [Candidatus Riflemargulisbacteria bacterium]